MHDQNSLTKNGLAVLFNNNHHIWDVIYEWHPFLAKYLKEIFELQLN